ncbi:hypothetical protein QQS21_008463 [Conoideocrella luteorostrata]|uniref:Response regulatory domain-containing protein n=1 Tax=Conoideocrella luteorostrata TaxID=1105319 RepID=A0AAJ0CIT5_9HYPO|nr:hypothetical protein QQS21_008463 [Conoideocrella luteorostrata]
MSDRAVVSTPSLSPPDAPPLLEHLHARLFGYARRQDPGNPKSSPDYQTISTPWIKVDVFARVPTVIVNGSKIIELARQLLTTLEPHRPILATMDTIHLCISPLPDGKFGKPATHELVSLPEGTCEPITLPINILQLVRSLTEWTQRWRRFQQQIKDQGRTLAASPSLKNIFIPLPKPSEMVDPLARANLSVYTFRRTPQLWVTPPAEALSSEASDVPAWFPPSNDPRTMLVAEDNVVNVMILAKMMHRLTLNFKIAQNGQEAYDEYKREPSKYWCVLMDISMPVVDGLTAAQWIRRFETESGLEPVVMVMMHPSSTTKRSVGLEFDHPQYDIFDYFLDKPVHTQHLASIVDSVRERRMRKALASLAVG